MRFKLAIFALAAATTAFSQQVQPAAASDPKPDARIANILEELGRTRSPEAAALSPDGRYLAWTQDNKLHLVETAHIHQDHTVSAPSGDSGCGMSSPAWSADSTRLAFLCFASGSRYPAIGLYDTSTDKSTRLASPDGSVSSLQWSPDGKTIAFLFVPKATRTAGALDAMKPAVGVIGRDNFEVQTLAAVATDDGQLSRITATGDYIYEFSWSPDSHQVVYTAAPAPGENNWWVAKLYTQEVRPVPLSGTYHGPLQPAPQLLVDPGAIPGPLHGLQMALPRFSPNGQDVAFTGGLMSDFGVTGGDLYIVKAQGSNAGRDTHPFTTGRKSTIAWFEWLDPDHVLISEYDHGRIHVAMLGTSGEQMPWLSQYFEGSAGSGSGALSLSVSIPARTVATIRSSFDHGPEVWYGSTNHMEQVSHLNDELKPAWGKTESFAYTNEGFDLQGFLLFPAHFDPAKKYPLIVFVHGGPASENSSHWPGAGFGAAPFSAMDYFVFLPNPRGSYGEGEAFTQANRKDFGYGDMRDILAGVDAIAQKYPAVDTSRLGLTGWSYGGFMTMFGVTQTTRFKAAVAGAGLSDWLSYYGENSIDQWMIPYFGASVYDDPAAYARSSAINFIKRVKTPMLIVVGDRDGECPAPQSFEMWHALRAQGVPTELVVYPDEGHSFRSPEHRVDVLTRALQWFHQYL